MRIPAVNSADGWRPAQRRGNLSNGCRPLACRTAGTSICQLTSAFGDLRRDARSSRRSCLERARRLARRSKRRRFTRSSNWWSATLWVSGGGAASAASRSMRNCQSSISTIGALRRGRRERETWLLDITTDLGAPCIVAISCTPQGTEFAFGAAARLTVAEAARVAFSKSVSWSSPTTSFEGKPANAAKRPSMRRTVAISRARTR